VIEPDEQLVRRYLEGDPAAFDTLLKRHETRIYNICLRILGNREDARDAAQDAFLTALRKLGQFRGDAAFTTLMHRVAVNACYDSLRKRRRQPMLRIASDDDHQLEPELGDPEPDHAEGVAGEIDVTRALAVIPEEFRVVLVLADVHDLPYEEIARVLEIPLGTVKSRVHRGRVALARAMGLAERPSPAGVTDPEHRREPDPTASASEEER
jgi:RNA polymerase sigma-70 factor (ECF subfamily)